MQKHRIFLYIILIMGLQMNTATLASNTIITHQKFKQLNQNERKSIENDITANLLQLPPNLQQAYVKASNTDAEDQFGFSIDLFENTLVVGAIYESSNANSINGDETNNQTPSTGAVYVYERVNGVWTQQAYIKASNSSSGDLFGASVALFENTLVVGATGEDSNGAEGDNSIMNSGALYVYTRTGNTWTQQAYIKASNPQPFSLFGFSVAIDNDIIVAGAPFESSNAVGVDGNGNNTSAPESGSAYVFTRTGNSWTQQAYLKATNTDSLDNFGKSVAVSGNTVAVGADGESSNATGVNNNQSNNSLFGAGAVYVYIKQTGAWQPQAYIKASNTDVGDNFGTAITLENNTIVVGATGESSSSMNQNDNSTPHSGAAYIFERNIDSWNQIAYIKASVIASNDRFGKSVKISNNTVAVGAPNGEPFAIADTGVVYIFKKQQSIWVQIGDIKHDFNNEFGHSVAISGNTIAVGDPLENSNAIGINGDFTNESASNSGSADIFVAASENIFVNGFE